MRSRGHTSVRPSSQKWCSTIQRNRSCFGNPSAIGWYQPVNFPASLLPVGVTPTTSRRIATRSLRRKMARSSSRAGGRRTRLQPTGRGRNHPPRPDEFPGSAQNLDRAVRTIRARFGLKAAFDYVVGEKLINFAEAAFHHPAFAQELPRFISEVRRNVHSRGDCRAAGAHRA